MIRKLYEWCNSHWSILLTVSVMGLMALFCLLFGGCSSQTRSAYRIEGTVCGQPASVEVQGVENTAGTTVNVGAAVQAAVAGFKGDIAGLAESVSKLANKPQAPVPVLPTKEEIAAAVAGNPKPDNTIQTLLAALGGLAPGIALAYAKSRETEYHKADAKEGWDLATKDKPSGA